MTFVWDPIYAVNLVLCVATLILGVLEAVLAVVRTAAYLLVAFALYVMAFGNSK